MANWLRQDIGPVSRVVNARFLDGTSLTSQVLRNALFGRRMTLQYPDLRQGKMCEWVCDLWRMRCVTGGDDGGVYEEADRQLFGGGYDGWYEYNHVSEILVW